MSRGKIKRQFGLWESPISPISLAQGIKLADVAWDSDGKQLVWLEERSGHGVLVCASLDGDAPNDLNTELSVRAKVGYGGGDFTLAGGYAYFVASSGRLYRQPLDPGKPVPITPEFGHAASPAVSPDGEHVMFVHSCERIDGLAIVDTEGKRWPQKLIFGDDFYMQPRWHPDGKRIVWISWNHPRMPWDGTELKLATLKTEAEGLPTVDEVQTIAGGEDVAIFQPEFSPDSRFLAYISDETGFGNLYLYDLQNGSKIPLTQDEVEHGRPAWIQGMRTYGFSSDGRNLYYIRNEAGFNRLWVYDLEKKEKRAFSSPLSHYTSLEQIALSPVEDRIAFAASSTSIPPRIITLAPGGKPIRVRRRSTAENVPLSELSQPQALSWSSKAGESIHGLYYPPHNPFFQGTGHPPAIIRIHGGPTSQYGASYRPEAQLFATRGYAVLEVNYRGSTGYGREYMEALRAKWGIYDVEDAVSGAEYLAEQGLADRERLVIMGGSAGGYAVLQALVNHPGLFKAAICMYGVSNLFTLAAETHKFEERYLDSLIGPLPEASAAYRDRSPIFHADQIQDPIAIFQGEEDKVVPRSQADTIVESLRQRGVPHEYHVYPGEGHGWRKSETIEDFYRKVEAFLRQYVLFA